MIDADAINRPGLVALDGRALFRQRVASTTPAPSPSPLVASSGFWPSKLKHIIISSMHIKVEGRRRRGRRGRRGEVPVSEKGQKNENKYDACNAASDRLQKRCEWKHENMTNSENEKRRTRENERNKKRNKFIDRKKTNESIRMRK